MPDTVQPWLATMRAITGTLEVEGSADNPVILAWRDEIARAFPDMASYCAEYTHDSIPWCGLTVAYCMAHDGIRPVFGATDTDRFLWAQAWKQFGTPVSHPQLGDVLVFARHVTLYDGEDGDSYLGRGGNQSDSVRLSHYAKSACEAIRRPPEPSAAARPFSAVVPISPVKRFAGITATVFGGQSDPNKSAYDGHFITDEETGVALPARFKGARPKVLVSKGSKSVVCDIVDIGPWNENDPYWETDTRPQAESGVDRRGRHTNLAGIDLTPAAARVIGVDGKGMVDWEFVGATAAQPVPTPVPDLPAFDSLVAALRQRVEHLGKIIAALPAGATGAQSQGAGGAMAPTPANDLNVLLQQVLALLQNVNTQPKPGTTPAAAQPADQLRKVVEIINAIIAPGGQPLGPVNGALGQTLGNLLNGKKSGIGILGALVTALLSQVPAGSGLGQILALLTPASGLSGFAMPIFLALAAWGVLGKLEKWTQGGSVPPPAPK